MTAPKKEAPNPEIDKAIKMLMKSLTKKKKEGEEMTPDEIQNAVRVVNVAIQWEKVKHHIKDDEEFDPNQFS
jgi:hypothetical protein